MGRIFRQLTITDRRKIEKMYLSGEKVKDMADTLRVNVSTIYRELKRGRYMHRNSDWTETERYSADIAEEKYQENLKAKGPVLKIGKDIELANYIEEKIADDGYSPEAALLDIKRKNLTFSVTITKQTLYKYIYDGIFMRVTADNLAIKRKRKSYHKIYIEKQREPLQEQALNRDRLILIRVRNSDTGRWTLLWDSRGSLRMHLLF